MQEGERTHDQSRQEPVPSYNRDSHTSQTGTPTSLQPPVFRDVEVRDY